MVSLIKDTYSIKRGRRRALINAGLRRNDLRFLPLEFSERALDAEYKAAEEYRRSVLEADVCDNDGCWTPTRKYEDFCSEECWEGWHAKYEPEALARATVR